jgi:hypothetical protein
MFSESKELQMGSRRPQIKKNRRVEKGDVSATYFRNHYTLLVDSRCGKQLHRRPMR